MKLFLNIWVHNFGFLERYSVFTNMRMYSAKWCNFSISQVTQGLLNSLQIFFFNKIFKSLWDTFTVWILMSQQLLNIMLSDTYEMGLQDYKSIPETLPPLKKIANESIMGLQYVICPYSARYLWTNNITSSLLIQIHTWMVMEIQWPWWPLYSPTVTFPLNVWQKSFVIAHADSWTWLFKPS